MLSLKICEINNDTKKLKGMFSDQRKGLELLVYACQHIYT